MTDVGSGAGPEGGIWFTGFGSNEIGRMSLDGVVERFALPTPASVPYHIGTGPDGALWFTEQAGNKIGRLEMPVRSSPPVASAATRLEPVLTISSDPAPFVAMPNVL